ncbi:MAG: hypothetical protein GX601_06985 [Anaerolineales bacterium]|nr:hypothetical protein [Anaerolineales bacterium]
MHQSPPIVVWRQARIWSVSDGTTTMAAIAMDESAPGQCQVDPAYHTGPSPVGSSVYTLHLVDFAAGWSESVAILRLSHPVMLNAF